MCFFSFLSVVLFLASLRIHKESVSLFILEATIFDLIPPEIFIVKYCISMQIFLDRSWCRFFLHFAKLFSVENKKRDSTEIYRRKKYEKVPFSKNLWTCLFKKKEKGWVKKKERYNLQKALIKTFNERRQRQKTSF